MATTFLEKLQIPEGFEELLHDLIKEILREQPENIQEFCVEYFRARKSGQPLQSNFRRNQFGILRDSEFNRQCHESCVSDSMNDGNESERQVYQKQTTQQEKGHPVDQGSQMDVREEKIISEKLPPSQKSIQRQPTIVNDKENMHSDPNIGTKHIESIKEIVKQPTSNTIEKKNVPETSQTFKKIGSDYVNDLTEDIIQEFNN